MSYLSGAGLYGYSVVKTSPPPWNMLVGKILHVYTVVKTTPPPSWNMLVRKKVATRLRSCKDHPSPSKYVGKGRCGYVVTQSLLSLIALFTLSVYSLRQPAFCLSA